MRLLSENLNLNDKYTLIEDNSLSFKDKVFSLYSEDTLRDLFCEDIPDFKHDELEYFKNLLEEIMSKKLKVLIVSDYDCDGVLALVIFSRLLDNLKIDYKYYIPSRIKEGYGLNDTIVDRAIKYHFDVLITIDNGVSAIDQLKKLKDNGIRTVVIDHHEYTNRPDTDVFLHPFIFDDYYHYMCSGALTLMISRAYMMDDYSVVLAMITVLSDVMKVYGVNRQILKSGIKILNEQRYLPIVNILDKETYSYGDMSFGVIPKINAISRMDHMTNVNILVKYFMDLDHDNRDTALQIEKINNLRKDLSTAMCEKGLKMIKENNTINVIYDNEFHEGLCGIAANKIVSSTSKPAIVMALTNGIYKGSGRSIDGINLYESLKKYDGYLAFGGHEKAVGLSINKDKLDSFIDYINNLNVDYKPSKKKLIRIGMDDLTYDNIMFLESLKPFGEGFAEPLFYIEKPVIKSCFMIKNLYPKYTLANGIEAISFDSRLKVQSCEGFIGNIKLNNYRNRIKINISLKEIVL